MDAERGDASKFADAWMLDWLVRCAHMLTSQAPAVSIKLLRLSVQMISADDPRRGTLACRLAEALLWNGDLGQAEQVARQAVLRARDPDLVIELYETLTYCQSRTGRRDEALTMLSRGPQAGPDGPAPEPAPDLDRTSMDRPRSPGARRGGRTRGLGADRSRGSVDCRVGVDDPGRYR